MIVGQEDKPPLDELAHYGVKGMKWGVTHEPISIGGGGFDARKKYSGRDIRAARRQSAADTMVVNAGIRNLNAATKAGNTAEAARIAKNLSALKAKVESSDAYSVAARLTRGEQITQLLLNGAVGATNIWKASAEAQLRAAEAEAARKKYGTKR